MSLSNVGFDDTDIMIHFCFYSKGLKLQNNIIIHSRQIFIRVQLSFLCRVTRGLKSPKGGLRISWWSQSSFWWTLFQVCCTDSVDHFGDLTPPLLIFWLIAKFFLMDIFSGPETTMIIANLGVGGCYWGPKRKIKNWPLNFTQLTAKGYSRHSFLDGVISSSRQICWRLNFKHWKRSLFVNVSIPS